MAYSLRAPWLIGLMVFWIYPTIASAYYSFTKFNGVQTPQWIGLQNYIRLFTDDANFRDAVFNTFYFAIVSIPLAITFVCPGDDAQHKDSWPGRLPHDLFPADTGA